MDAKPTSKHLFPFVYHYSESSEMIIFWKQKHELLVKEVQSRSPAFHDVLHLVIILTTGLLAATAKPVFCSSLWLHRGHPRGLPYRSPK